MIFERIPKRGRARTPGDIGNLCQVEAMCSEAIIGLITRENAPLARLNEKVGFKIPTTLLSQ